MSEKKWTKGPWQVYEAMGDVGVSPVTPDMSDICEMVDEIYRNGDGSTKANAHLIAAAPDLYEAVEELIEMLDYDKNSKRYNDAWDAALTALAKARGEK